MSRRNTHTATNNQECHVFGCTGHVDKLFCVGENCFHKVCKLHYDKSARCQSCNPPAPSAVIAEATSYTNTYVHPVEELSKLKKSKLLKDWSDEAMLHLCQQVQLSRAHFKTEETMVSKWGRVCNSCFSKFPSLVACKWQALQSHYQQTAKALKDLSLTIQRTSRNAEEMKLNDWQMLMLSLISEAERAGYSRNASHEKVAREKESMMPMEEEVLSKQDDNALDDCNDDVAVEEDCISSISFSPPSSKRHKTSIRSTSPLPNSVEAIRAETYRLIAETRLVEAKTRLKEVELRAMMEDHRVAREARSEAREIAYAARDERREARWDAMMNHMIRIHASLVGVTQSASSPLKSAAEWRQILE